jgi:hypothetical protein
MARSAPALPVPTMTVIVRRALMGLMTSCAVVGLCSCGSATTTSSTSVPKPTTIGPVDTPSVMQSGVSGSSLSSAGRNRLWNCTGGSVEVPDRPWVTASDELDLSKRPVIKGSNVWQSKLSITWKHGRLSVSGNGIPDHVTGTYPVTASDGSIYDDYLQVGPSTDPADHVAALRQTSFFWNESSAGGKVTTPSCVPYGPIGIMTSGALLWSALESGTTDFSASLPPDSCFGTVAPPTTLGMYHYHSFSPCLDRGSPTAQSPVVGYIFDGIPITGSRGAHGKVLTNKELDACHGTTSVITYRGHRVRMYHYVANYEFPYTVGCFMGAFSVADSNLSEPPSADGGPAVRPGSAPSTSVAPVKKTANT